MFLFRRGNNDSIIYKLLTELLSKPNCSSRFSCDMKWLLEDKPKDSQIFVKLIKYTPSLLVDIYIKSCKYEDDKIKVERFLLNNFYQRKCTENQTYVSIFLVMLEANNNLMSFFKLEFLFKDKQFIKKLVNSLSTPATLLGYLPFDFLVYRKSHQFITTLLEKIKSSDEDSFNQLLDQLQKNSAFKSLLSSECNIDFKQVGSNLFQTWLQYRISSNIPGRMLCKKDIKNIEAQLLKEIRISTNTGGSPSLSLRDAIKALGFIREISPTQGPQKENLESYFLRSIFALSLGIGNCEEMSSIAFFLLAFKFHTTGFAICVNEKKDHAYVELGSSIIDAWVKRVGKPQVTDNSSVVMSSSCLQKRPSASY